MNLVAGQIRAGHFLTHCGASPVPLPPEFAHPAEGRAVTLGLWLENVRLAGPQDAGAQAALVEVVELTGPEMLALPRMGQGRIMASLSPDAVVRAEAACHVAFERASVVLFATATERQLDSVLQGSGDR